MHSLRGQLLVAAPTLLDPNFARTVILIAEHGEDGALGVILNRPGDALVDSISPDLACVCDGDDPVFVGGPVQPEGVLVLAEFEDVSLAALAVDDEVGFVSLDADLEELEGATKRARAFSGHAGWGPGQLDAEIEEESWYPAPFTRDDAFTDDPDELWSRALVRKGGAYALVARMPIDPSLN